jgi:hypothetical protein
MRVVVSEILSPKVALHYRPQIKTDLSDLTDTPASGLAKRIEQVAQKKGCPNGQPFFVKNHLRLAPQPIH